MSKRTLHALCALLILFSTFSSTTRAMSARWVTYVPTGAEEIDLRKDHYSVELVASRISSKDPIVKALLAKNSRLVVSINSTISFDHTEKRFNQSKVFVETDINRKIDQPVGLGWTLMDRLPGSANPQVAIQVSINKDDRLNPILDSLAQERAALETTTDALSGPWLGYTKLAMGIINKIFDPAKTENPLQADFQIKSTAVATAAGKMKSHYIILIAPKKGEKNDYVMSEKDSGFEFADGQLTHGTGAAKAVVNDRTYFVLKVAKSQGYDVPTMLARSTAPWAEFGRARILDAPLLDVTNADQLKTYAKASREFLKAQESLLQEELRFLPSESARVLVTLAETSVQRVKTQCTALTIAPASCPTTDLQDFVDRQKGIQAGVAAEDRAPAPVKPAPANQR